MALSQRELDELDLLEKKYGSVSPKTTPPAESANSDELNTLEAKYGHLIQNTDLPAKEEVDASPFKQFLHAVKGPGEFLIKNTLDAPNALTTISHKGLNSVLKMATGNELPNYPYSPSPFFGTFPKLSDKPYIKPVVDAIASREYPEGKAPPAAESARTALGWLSSAPLTYLKGASIAPDIIGSAVATGSEAASRYLGNKNPQLAQLAGIPAQLAASIRGGHKARAIESARKYVDELISDASALRAKVISAVHSGEKGTLADIGGEQVLFDIESGLSRDPLVGRKIDNVVSGRQQQIADIVRQQDPTSVLIPGQAAKDLGNYVTRRKSTIDTAKGNVIDDINASVIPKQEAINAPLLAAQNDSQKAISAEEAAKLQSNLAGLPLATNKHTAETSTKVSSTIDNAEEVDRIANVDPAWKAYNEQPPVSIRPVQKAISETFSSLDPRLQEMFFKRYYNRLFKPLESGTEITPVEYQAIIKDMKGVKNKEIEDTGFSMLDPFIIAMDRAHENTNALYSAAKNATRTKYERFYPENVGKARNTAAPETLASTIGISGDKGYQTARVLGASDIPGLPGAVFEHLKAAGNMEGINQKFLDKYSGVLKTLPPEQSQHFTNYVESAAAQKAAEEAAKIASRQEVKAGNTAVTQSNALTRSVEKAKSGKLSQAQNLENQLDNTIVAKYAANPDTTIRGLLSTTDNIPQLKRLMDASNRVGRGAEFKADLRERLAGVTLGRNAEESARLQKMYVESGIVSPREMDYITNIISKNTANNTMREKAVHAYIGDTSAAATGLIPSVLAASSMQVLPAGHSLIVAGALRRFFTQILKRHGDYKTDAVRKVEEFMLNPEKYLSAAKDAKNAKEASSAIITELVGTSKAAELLQENNDAER